MKCIKHETIRNSTLKPILVSSASSSPSVEFHLAARACQGAGSALAARGTQRWKQPMVPLVARRGTIVNNEVCPMSPRSDTEHTELCKNCTSFDLHCTLDSWLIQFLNMQSCLVLLKLSQTYSMSRPLRVQQALKWRAATESLTRSIVQTALRWSAVLWKLFYNHQPQPIDSWNKCVCSSWLSEVAGSKGVGFTLAVCHMQQQLGLSSWLSLMTLLRFYRLCRPYLQYTINNFMIFHSWCLWC